MPASVLAMSPAVVRTPVTRPERVSIAVTSAPRHNSAPRRSASLVNPSIARHGSTNPSVGQLAPPRMSSTRNGGTGVFGLRRAFELAEVRTVVMSLWRVPDQQALQWMTTFYRERARGRTIVTATRTASLDSLRELRDRDRPTHPYLWAGFVAAGDWRWLKAR